MKVYISGPITGLHFEQNVVPVFAAAQLEIEEAGHEAVNPLNNGIAHEAAWSIRMRADLKMMLDCDMIYMLPGWMNSRGARLEFQVANILGIREYTNK